MPRDQGTPVTRQPLSRDRVLQAAVDLADREGVASLSMRRLARSLGFEVMSLYNHVPSKEDLLDGMLERVAGQIAPAHPEGPWKDAVRANAADTRQVLLQHPWAAALWFSRTVGPVRMALLESLLRVLADSPLPDELAHRAFHAVTTHVLGSVLQELAFDLSPDEVQQGAATYLASMPAKEFPHLARHVRQHAEQAQPDDDFEFELDLILDGLERIAAAC